MTKESREIPTYHFELELEASFDAANSIRKPGAVYKNALCSIR